MENWDDIFYDKPKPNINDSLRRWIKEANEWKHWLFTGTAVQWIEPKWWRNILFSLIITKQVIIISPNKSLLSISMASVVPKQAIWMGEIPFRRYISSQCYADLLARQSRMKQETGVEWDKAISWPPGGGIGMKDLKDYSVYKIKERVGGEK